MTERTADAGRGVTLAYERVGDPGAEPLVLVAGLGMQLHSWPTAFCRSLADRGYEIVRFDNRDVGRSTHLGFRPPSPAALLTRRLPGEQYDLADMADDTAALIGELGRGDVHLVGLSMGGMIAQTVAARHPATVRTLTSIMSTTGAARTGRPALTTWRHMLARVAPTEQAASDHAVRMFRHIGSRGFPFDEAAIRDYAAVAWERDPTRDGTGRQLGAIVKSGDRTAALRGITAPTLVIHGDRDRMVNPTGGAATARAVPGARLVTVRGMGHDLPEGAWPQLIDLIDEHARTHTRQGRSA